MRFHVLGIPHTVTNHKFVACAYTQKAFKFCKMMKARDHHVIHYGHEDSDPDCNEHVTVVTNEDFNKAYGSYDWKKEYFKYNLNDAAYTAFYRNAIREIGKRKQKNDFILPFWGSGVRPVCDAHKDLLCVEPGIGYASGHWAQFKIFESYAILHAYMNLDSAKRCNSKNYDVVIPNYFDPEEFEFSTEKDDYVLFLGRVYSGKGLHIAVQATEHIGAKLLVAGHNSMEKSGYKTIPPHVTDLGYADLEQRKKLLSKARCVITASQFLEPFCGVHMEALMSGTPVISTDWGVFTETNLHGITGYRCRTFNDFVWAIRNSHKISPYHCRDWAMNFSLDQVAVRYEKYFKDVLNVARHKGWYDTLEPVSHMYIPRYPNTSVDPRYVGIGVDTTRGETSVCNNLDWAIIKDTDDLGTWKKRARHVTVVHSTGKNRHLLKYKDIHKGKKGLIVCNGPSAKEFDFSKLDSDTIVVGFNGIFMTEISKYLDYYFVNDFGNTSYKNCARSNPVEIKNYQPKLQKFFSHKLKEHLDYTDGYEMYYYRDNVNLIKRDGCIIPNPDFLGSIDDDLTQPITTFGSVTFVGLQFLVWCGIKDIDIIGVDINSPMQVTGENRIVPYAVIDHLLYWCNVFKYYEKSDVVFRTSFKDLMKFPQTSRTIAGKGTNLEFACDVLNIQMVPGTTEYDMNKYDLVNYIFKKKPDKLKWYYFYTKDYDMWNKHLSTTLGGHFNVQPICVDSLDIHKTHKNHIFTGSVTKVKLIIDAIKKNMGQRIVFTDATWSINKNNVQELYDYLNSISETTYTRNTQYLKNPKTVQNIGFILLQCNTKELQLWEKCLEFITNDTDAHDQTVINELIGRNNPTFDVTKIIADNNPEFDSSFYAIKFFIDPLIDSTTRNSKRLELTGKYGLQPLGIQNFWETSDPKFSHLHTRLMDDPENNFMKFIDFRGKAVLDYGCGSAVLGKTLFDQKNISKYIGVDISKRSLEYSKNTLENYKQVELLHETEYYDNSPRCDIFISRACIQHFPDMEYLDKFLGKIKEIGPKTVMLQIRNNGSNMCNNKSYDSIKNIVDRCYTTPEYILEKLGNDYNIWFKSQIMEGTKYQFIIFTK